MTHLRQGRRVPRHLYHQQGAEPADTDPPVGMVDTPELAATIVSAVNAAHDRTNDGYDPRTEVDAHWEHDQERRTAYADRRAELARAAEANQWERRLAEELQARDTERDETVNQLASDLANAERENRRLTAELAQLKRN